MEAVKLELMDESVDLLTSILVKYPVINTVDLNFTNKLITISFLIDDVITYDSWQKQKEVLKKNFRLYNKFENKKTTKFKLVKNDYQNLTKIDLIRSLKDLSNQELDFMIKVIKNNFTNKILQNEEMYYKEQLESIDKLLQEINQSNFQKKEINYLAFREEDRVLIFDKNNK